MDLDSIRDLRARLHEQIGKVVVGQSTPIDLLLIALLAQGHVLLHGVPGVAKTLLARCFAACLGLEFRRIQFTPDLMPGDVVGTNLFDFHANQFQLMRGPIFTQLLLADEINRTPPKTQAALLEAMQERSVTIDGTSHDLGAYFMVIATQNPIEQEGTYPLPEAQMDRFLFKVDVGYPDRDAERSLVARHGRGSGMPKPSEFDVGQILEPERLEEARRTVREVLVAEEVVDYVVDVVRASREQTTLLAGASPRAAAMLAAASRALAAVSGRDFVTPDDVKRLAMPCLAHRVVLSPGAEIEGHSCASVIRSLLEEVPAPR
ncbi:MAG: AAA family ATPase [Planctomycetota bacterium]|nr:AAA family ATPase [Planctomycetota bacterium]